MESTTSTVLRRVLVYEVSLGKFLLGKAEHGYRLMQGINIAFRA